MESITKHLAAIVSLYLAIALACPVTGCQSSAARSPSVNSSFTDKYWVMTAFTAAPGIDWDLDGTVETDILPKLEPCEKDDAIMFRKDNQVLRHHGANRCDEDEEEVEEAGTWQYTPATRQLTRSGDGSRTATYTVVEVSGSKLVLQQNIEGKNKRHVLTATFKAK